MVASIVAKLVASSITYPHEVLRARMQDARNDPAHNKSNLKLRQVFHDIVEVEGFWSLWTGLRVNLVRIIPATLATFVSYEYLSRYLRNFYNM
jgi:solute carrier family 25 folate transporter 32